MSENPCVARAEVYAKCSIKKENLDSIDFLADRVQLCGIYLISDLDMRLNEYKDIIPKFAGLYIMDTSGMDVAEFTIDLVLVYLCYLIVSKKTNNEFDGILEYLKNIEVDLTSPIEVLAKRIQESCSQLD